MFNPYGNHVDKETMLRHIKAQHEGMKMAVKAKGVIYDDFVRSVPQLALEGHDIKRLMSIVNELAYECAEAESTLAEDAARVAAIFAQTEAKESNSQ